jgi:hypothetical protein
MKAIITLFSLFLFLQANAQDRLVYTESGTSFFLQVGPANNIYSELVTIGTSASFFNETQSSRVDRSISMGIALELIRGNVGIRLQTNRVKIDETFELSSSISDNSFGEFTNSSSSVTRGNQINYEIIPGVHRYFQVNNWSFSGGIEMPFTVYDIYKFSQNTESEFSSSDFSFNFSQKLTDEMTGELPGGYDIGIGANFGLQYAFNNTIKVGMQYAPSIRHYKIGGETEFIRKSKQVFIEQFENEPETTTTNSSTINTTNTSTNSKTADFRQRMNFALIFSF